MTKENLRTFIFQEIDFDKIKKNVGIYETSTIGNVSIGVSFEDDDDGNERYIYNLFVGIDEKNNISGEYINIFKKGNVTDEKKKKTKRTQTKRREII